MFVQAFHYRWNSPPQLANSPYSDPEHLLFNQEGLISLNDSAAVLRCLEQLHVRNDAEGTLARWKQQLIFQELLHTIMLDRQMANEQGSTQLAVEKAIAYMESHYMDEISIRSLAQNQGISPSNFAGMFKKQTGMRPVEYLAHLRMQHAKASLAAREGLKTVATKVGYRDELYFSRTFKKIVGVSPTLYAKKHSEDKLMTVFPQLNDYLPALDLRPFATLSYAGNDQIRGLLPHIAEDLKDVKIMGRWDHPDKETVLRADPQLILGTNWHSLMMDSYRNVAPTITVWMKDDWRSTLYDVAGLFGKKEQAADWLRMYDQRVAEARARLRASNQRGKSVMVLVAASDEWRVYGGKRQLGDILYRDLGLSPPQGISSASHYTVISQQDLCRLNPDYLILSTCNSNFNTQLTDELKQSGTWSALRAVQSNQVMEVPSWFNMHAPMQHLRSMNLIVNYLTSRSS
ncbi:ABC-type Fe3+-hydroxamate transport system substrate-binding protein [Paenibacillus qinlingensis]|uniref:ABC-type Fe3+-hydroxamate transport system substrate-binding protein n=2 Tax=Paenibacillus qinlingensis TaxID=1837343 RepID=A0ABU1NTD9_9BACL|nr:ABC-type Fe3+-hydroxamate transport system substrate-binding protein [Paenibacillus qinlingensis]